MTEAPIHATGRRKNAVARVYLKPGDGHFLVNDRPIEEYFPVPTMRANAQVPLVLSGTQGRFDVLARVAGGGISGQAGAVRHALARALLSVDKDYRVALKKAGFLTRDPRMKERRKYGLKKARKAPQFSKR